MNPWEPQEFAHRAAKPARPRTREAIALEPVLRAQGITKRYGSVTALDHVDFEISAGEVVGLLGDNGAGKSTLVKVLCGAVMPDSGRVEVRGRPLRLGSPEEARRAGIETVYQDLALAEHLDVAANVFLGRERVRPGLAGRLGLLEWPSMRADTARGLESLGIDIPLTGVPVGRMSGGQRQAVAVARAVLWGSSVLLMDEPTAALGVAETELVIGLIGRLKAQGLPIVIITHDLPDALRICDRLVILRHGRVAAAARTADTNIDQVVGWMTGSRATA
jgi:simple sugar transport system ATP-binding protein